MKCVNCGQEAYHIHHIIPKSLGGTDRNTNKVPLCDKCHGILHGIEYSNGIIPHSVLIKKGMQKAKLEGKQIGRKQGSKINTKKYCTSKDIIIKYSKDFNGKLKDDEVIKICNINRGTYYKYKRKIKEEMAEQDNEEV